MKKASKDWPPAAGECGKHVHTLHMWTQIVGKIRLGFHRRPTKTHCVDMLLST